MLERICDVVSRKRKIGLGVLAVLIVFCLWYTRPRSFDDLIGDGRVKSISMVTSIYVFEEGLPHYDVWTVDSHEGREAVNEELEALLKSCKYRVSLRSFFTFLDSFRGSYSIPGDKGDPFIVWGAVLEDGSTVSAQYRGSTVSITTDNRIIAKATDKEIGDKLAAYIQEFGWR